LIMRKASKRKVRRAVAPTMVALSVVKTCEIAEQMAITALVGGWATPTQFDCLLDCADLLLLAAADRHDDGCREVAYHARDALHGIAARFRAVGKIGATGDEVKALRVLVDVSRDFWYRKSGVLFADAYTALEKFRATQAEKAEKAAA